MSRIRRYLLHPRGAFHFGERGVGVEETAEMLHSDTLFAAIVSAWRMLGMLDDEASAGQQLLAQFVAREPPFRISSALPFAGPIQLYPRPLIPLGVEKALKDVRYVSAAALNLIAAGQRLTPERADQELIQGGNVWVLPQEREQIVAALLEGERDPDRRAQLQTLWKREPARMQLWQASEALTPRVTVDRRSSAANLFHIGRLRFAHGCGLAFWAAFNDDALTHKPQLDAALAVLQDEGLGGRRSVGHGQFTLEESAAGLPSVSDATHYMALSLYAPAPAEYGALANAWYKRILRRGWIYSPNGRNLRRKGIWMLREGSLFTTPPDGSIHDVRPDLPQPRAFPHPVWRYGFALNIPLRLENFA